MIFCASLIGLGSTLAGCGTPKETVNVLLDDNAMTDYQYDAMRHKNPAKSRDSLQDDWDKMTKAERDEVMQDYSRSMTPVLPPDYYEKQMAELYKKKLLGGEGHGGGGGGD